VLVLRAEPDAARTAAKLAARGYTPLVAPLFIVTDAGEALPAGEFDALLVASAHGAARLADERLAAMRSRPVFAVGAQTARVAAEAGFSEIRIGDGDRHALSRLVAETLPPEASLLAVLGRDRHEDWIDALRRRGHPVAIWTAYEAAAVDALPAAAADALRAEPDLAILHFSQRAADVFLALARQAGLETAAVSARHVAMSAEVAASLAAAGARRLAIAGQPTLAAMIQALDHMPIRVDRAGVAGQDVAKIVKDAAGLGGSSAEGERVAGKSRQKPPKEPEASPQEALANDGAVDPHAEADRAVVEDAQAPSAAADAVNVGPVAAPPQPDAPAADTEPAAPPVAPRTTPPADAPRGLGWGAVLAAGLIGGLVGGGGLFAAQTFYPSALKGPGTSAPATGELDARFAAIDRRFAGLASQSELQSVSARATEAAELAGRLRNDLAAAQKALEALAARPASAPAPVPAGAPMPAGNPAVAERLARAEAASREAAEALAAARGRIDALEAGLKPLAGPRAQAAAAAQLLLIERVRAALESGRPFTGDVNALKASGVGDATLRPLAALADAGAPKRDALRAELRKQRRVLSEDSAAMPDSWSDRAWRLMGRIVSVQRVDGGKGETPAALVEVIDSALASGNDAAASAAWRALPEPARRASAGLGEALAARAAAIAALAEIGETSVKALQARQE
jgi:uroporphyrinogen-III synthase